MSARVAVFIVAAAACAVAQIAILASVVSRGTRSADPGVPRPRFGVEILWAVIPALALAFLLTATWPRVRDADSKPKEVLRVAR